MMVGHRIITFLMFALVILFAVACQDTTQAYAVKSKVENTHIKKGLLGGETRVVTLSFVIKESKFLQDVELTPFQFEYCMTNKEVDIQVVFLKSNNSTSITILLMGSSVYKQSVNDKSQRQYLNSFIDETETLSSTKPKKELTEEEKKAQEVHERYVAYMIGGGVCFIILLFIYIYYFVSNVGYRSGDPLTRYGMYCYVKAKEAKEQQNVDFNKLEAKEMVVQIDTGEFTVDDIKSEYKRKFVDTFLKEKYKSLEQL